MALHVANRLIDRLRLELVRVTRSQRDPLIGFIHDLLADLLAHYKDCNLRVRKECPRRGALHDFVLESTDGEWKQLPEYLSYD